MSMYLLVLCTLSLCTCFNQLVRALALVPAALEKGVLYLSERACSASLRALRIRSARRRRRRRRAVRRGLDKFSAAFPYVIRLNDRHHSFLKRIQKSRILQL